MAAWPLDDIRIESESVTLRYMPEEHMRWLATHSHGLVLAPHQTGYLSDWPHVESESAYRHGFLSHHWNGRVNWSPQAWTLPFGVYIDGREEPIGTQDLHTQYFLTTKTVNTGSWLLREFQSQGYGGQMREAALWFAFHTLGAERARTSANIENERSRRVTTRLGYWEDGTEEHVVQGVLRIVQRYCVDRATFERHCRRTPTVVCPPTAFAMFGLGGGQDAS
jgi:RimJ/RimL family protein N-acetyltransferase